jgi:RNA polymerase sigma factor (sigma-70 family)
LLSIAKLMTAVNRFGVWFVIDDVHVAVGLSFEDLFRVQYPRLVAVGLAVVGSVEVARDLAQETMTRAHANWETVANFDVPEAWLRRVMNNLLVDHLRRREAERGALERLARRPGPTTSVAGESRLAEMLAVLPERQRLVAALTYVGDLPVVDVAAALGIAPGTVKASLWKARRTLEKHLTKLEPVDERT